MSEFFKSCKSDFIAFESELRPFSINWFSATCVNTVNTLIYKNVCAKSGTCYNEKFEFDTHFAIIFFTDHIRIEFSDFYFYIKKASLYKMSKLAIPGESQKMNFIVRPYWLTSGYPLKDDYEMFINLSFGDKI